MQNEVTVTPKPESRLFATALAVSYAAVLTLVVLLVLMLFISPKFMDIFYDFDVALPGLTLWLIEASLWVAGTPVDGEQFMPGYVLVLWFIACLLISTIVFHILFAKWNKKNTLLTFRFLLLFNIPVLLIFGLAFLVPLMTMIKSVSEQ